MDSAFRRLQRRHVEAGLSRARRKTTFDQRRPEGWCFIGAFAFDSKMGRELWPEKLDANAHAAPIAFAGGSGKQNVAIVAGGNPTLNDATPGAEALAYFLP